MNNPTKKLDIKHFFLKQIGIIKYQFLEPKTKVNYYSTNGYHKYKCIFVHIPKTAGVSIAKSIFGSLGGGHKTIKEYQNTFGPYFNWYFKFAFVRNPWDRLYSAYTFLKNGGFNDLDKKWYKENLSQYRNFEQFVTNWLTPENITKKYHFYPQFHFITDNEGKIAVDFLGHYENLLEDINYVSNKLKITINLKHSNKSVRKSDYRKMYTPEMICIVDKIYQKDISEFGYNFN